MPDIADILTKLCEIPGPSGFETRIAERVREIIAPYMDETRIDILGNVIGVRRCGRDNAKKLLFDAHIDEIGFIVTGIQDGFLKIAALGSVDKRLLPASELTILTDPPIPGVISALPPHVLKDGDGEKAAGFDELFVDIGMTGEAAEKTVPLGTPCVFKGGVQKFGDNSICGKALDDRTGVAAIIRALELLKNERLNVDLYVMASVQEELGLRGAAPGVFSIEPDFCVAVDVDFAKTPDTKPGDTRYETGSGVIISRGPNMNTAFTDMAVNLALENGIAHKISVEPGGNSGTNAMAIQVSRCGVATALFGIPLKYMHTPNEIVSVSDIESAARLLAETAKRLKG